MPTIKVVYEFEFRNGERFVHTLRLDKETVSLIPDRTEIGGKLESIAPLFEGIHSSDQ